MNYTLQYLPAQFTLDRDGAEELAGISPLVKEQMARDIARAFDGHMEAMLCGTSTSSVEKPEPLDLRDVMEVCRDANRQQRRRLLADRRPAHALTHGYMKGISGSSEGCPFVGGALYRIWHEGRKQGREHRARTHEGDTGSLTHRTVEAALIRLGMA